jgi:CHASE1-domain containing sensor protein
MISERDDQGRLKPFNKKAEYFPVYYVEPYGGNEAALGFDLASNNTRLSGLILARDTNQKVATARIQLVQEKEKDQYGFLAFDPVHETHETKKVSIGVKTI